MNRLRTRLVLQQPTGLWTNAFACDAAHRLTNVTSGAGSFGYQYLGPQPSHLISKLTLPNGSSITNGFDPVARLLATVLRKSDSALLNKHEYSYNSGNQPTGATRTDGSTVSYAYDNIGQLTVADSSADAEDTGYLYDAAWNLSRRTNNGAVSTFNVDSKNELTNAPSPAGRQIYDNNGNLVGSHYDGAFEWTYYYDEENRLIALYRTDSVDDTTLTEFSYDGLGRLRVRLEYIPLSDSPDFLAAAVSLDSPAGWSLVSETHYIYDGKRVIQERDGGNTPTVSYTRGSDLSGSLEGAGGIGGLLARSSGYSGGAWTSHAYYHADNVGNITCLVDSGESLVASYRYDPFGNTISQSGALADANVYRFSSKEIHVNSGMYYFLYRFYDPSLQRWVNRDPIGEAGGLNLYCFTQNGPIGFFDPCGLNWFTGLGHQINTALGTILGNLGSSFGGDGPYTDESGRKHFEYSPLILPGRAITIGNVSIYSGSMDDRSDQQTTVSQHEGAHVGQSEDLGIFYGPAYLCWALAIAEMGGNWWADHPMELGPNSSPPVSWP